MMKSKPFPWELGAIFLALAPSLVTAQSLGEPQPVTKLMESTQFGMPADSKFIFCDGEDCPNRTGKTLTAPKAAPVPVRPVALPRPQSIALPVELSPAKTQAAPAKAPAKKRVKSRPKKAKTECGPLTQNG